MTLSFNSRLVLGLAAAVAGVVTLTSCRSSSSSGGSPAAPTGSVSSAHEKTGTSGPASAPAAGGTQQIDVCAVLSAAKASQLSGQQITTAGPVSGLGAHEYGCAYSNDDSSVQIQVQVFAHDAKSNYDLVSSQSKSVTQVPGLGDKAFYDNDETMYVLAGNDLIQVNGLAGADHCAALARPVLAAL